MEAAIALSREVGIAGISMTAVARRLGVHRSALNYHVRDRDELVGLVAGAALDLAIADDWAPADEAPWQDWVRAFAVELRTTLLENEPLALYFRLPDASASALRHFDRFGGRLYRAGFGTAGAAKAVVFVAQIVFMSVRDALMTRESGQHPQDRELARALGDESVPLPHLRAFLDAGGRPHPDDQFDFDLGCAIAGLEAALATMLEAGGDTAPT